MKWSRIVRIDHPHLGGAAYMQFRQACVVGLNPLPVMHDKPLHQRQRQRRAAVAVDLPVVVERISDMKEPAFSGVDGIGGVASGLAGLADQNDAIGHFRQRRGGGKIVPQFGFARRVRSRRAASIDEALIRISVGLEPAQDLIGGFAQAFTAAR